MGGYADSPSRAYAVPGSSGLVSGAPTKGGGFCGFSLRETAGAVAIVRIRDGGASGLILATVGFTALQSQAAWLGDAGVYTEGQLYFEKVSGTIEGSVFVS